MGSVQIEQKSYEMPLKEDQHRTFSHRQPTSSDRTKLLTKGSSALAF